MTRPLLCIAALLCALAAPSAALAQGAGDEQYQDPFGDEGGQSEPQGGGQDDSQDEAPAGDDGSTTPTPPPDDTPEDPGPAEDPRDEQEKALPNTGSDPRILAFVGVLFVLIGVGLRLRTIDPDAY